MALVGYSDSEGSDIEDAQPKIALDSKKFDRTSAKKIKVDLSRLTTQTADDETEEPAVKRQRTAGAFNGFNSLLPAPRRTAQPTMKKGINLRTSSEAAFSRAPAVPAEPEPQQIKSTDIPRGDELPEPVKEIKLVGKSTRFVPLSVANARNKKPSMPPVSAVKEPPKAAESVPPAAASADDPNRTVQTEKKPKRSLFSVTQSEIVTALPGTYEPEFSQPVSREDAYPGDVPQETQSNMLAEQAALQDMNLSAADRRRLFGRNAKRDDIKVAHFNMDAEYQHNQELAAKGEAVEHTAVRAIAPGKHSLQQLVNNVRGQADALEDKWAEGRRNRAEAGNRYGF